MAHILVVDDDEMVANAVSRGLKIRGFEVTTVNHPLKALDLFQAGERFDVVVSDLEMPGMNGDSLCRSIQRCVPTPVILCSGKAEVLSLYKDCGAKAGFMKPVAPSELQAEIAKYVQPALAG